MDAETKQQMAPLPLLRALTFCAMKLIANSNSQVYRVKVLPIGGSKMETDRDDEANLGQGYDVAMIRDFLEHLEWEVRIAHAEVTHLTEESNDELAGALAECMRKRSAIGLLAAQVVDRDGASDEEVDRACQLLRSWNERRTALSIQALEVLKPLFNEAMVCAASKSVVVRRLKAKDVIARLDKTP